VEDRRNGCPLRYELDDPASSVIRYLFPNRGDNNNDKSVLIRFLPISIGTLLQTWFEEILPSGVAILYAPFVEEIFKPSLIPQFVLIKLWVAP
jgi:hypothetical protein